jgi:D-inositol-3-phosphate glycosyltransferase
MRLAMISFHTSPLAPLGMGKAGGMNAYILGLGQELARRGIEVDCFTRIQDEKTPPVVPISPKMRIISLPAGPPIPLSPSSLIPHLEEFRAAMEAFREREGKEYHLLHAHYYLSGWVGLRLREKWQIPLLFMFHTIAFLKDGTARQGEEKEPPARHQIEREVAHGADLVIASNPHEGDSIHNFFQIPADRVAIVPCGVDTHLFRPLDQEKARRELGLSCGKILLFVGRIEPIKGIDLLFQAMAKLRFTPDLRREPFPKLILVGGAEGMDAWKARTKRWGLHPWLLFLGPKPHRSMPLYYAACDALVIPSRYESFGIVALEAAACGRPVIATQVGGLPYAVSPGKTSLMVLENDPTSLALAIRRVLTDEELAKSLGQAGRGWAESFSWPRISDRILACYEKAMAIPAGGGRERNA